MTGQPVPVSGVLLAGGLARRMGGGDKCLRQFAGAPLLERIIRVVRPQVSPLIVNAAGDPVRFEKFALPVVADVIEGFAGPLAGILTGLEWTAANAPGVEWMASFATDAPFLPEGLVQRMMVAREQAGADLACAQSGGRTHPVFGLWPVRLRGELRRAMVEEDMRKIDKWTARYRIVHVDFACDPVDPFFNINRDEDLKEAERLLAAAGV